MHKRKLLIGLASAGLVSTGFGAAVLPASAELRNLTITLLGGKTVTVTVDVPPGTPLNQIKLPGITAPVLSVQDAGPAAPAAATGASSTVAPTGNPNPTPTDAPTIDAPKAGKQDAQKTTGTKKRKPSTVAVDAPTGAAGPTGPTGAAGPTGPTGAAGAADDPADKVKKATEDVNADGSPTAVNPTFSFGSIGPAPVGVPNFFIDKFRIPPFLLPIYQAAGIQYGIRWEVLAAINEIETDYGRNLSVSSAGAEGWMQFMPATWKLYGVDANNDKKKDPYNPVDAIFTAARYLRAAGADKDIKKAIFSYNHASWYVDSVIMRARLIGGYPSDLIGSLTGLTQGRFPVAASARYAEDGVLAKAGKRVSKKARNAALSVTGDSKATGTDIFAKAGSSAVAVQDGRIVKMGVSERMGTFVTLRDAYGNTYTYGGLKKLSRGYPVPKDRQTRTELAKSLEMPKRDPAPTVAASAGTQDAKGAKQAARAKAPTADLPSLPSASTGPAVTDADGFSKERLFARPSDPANYKAGGEEQILNAQADEDSISSYITGGYGLKRSDVTIKPLRKGATVVAGTILGRIGKNTTQTAPHLRFEIRPAGKGAPRIDPKPILDGWKLLESSAVYRAKGDNPFLGGGDASIGQVLLLSKEQLGRRVLADPRVSLVGAGTHRDIEAGAIDRRVLATLEFLSASGLKPTVSCLRSGHSRLTTGGNVSEHSSGNAVDISAINGIPIKGHQGPGSITDITIRRLLTLQGTMKPHQIISLMTFDGADNTLALPDHDDHIHVGFRPLYTGDEKLSQGATSILKPAQWAKLIQRIGSIDNPTVSRTPSKAAIPVYKKKTSGATK